MVAPSAAGELAIWNPADRIASNSSAAVPLPPEMIVRPRRLYSDRGNGARQRGSVFEQLFFHASGVSPAFLQAFLVTIQSSPQPEAPARALADVERVLGLLDQTLKDDRPFVAGDAYSIADIAHFGWLWRHQSVGVSLDKFPSIARWYAEVSARPAVITAISKTVVLAQ